MDLWIVTVQKHEQNGEWRSSFGLPTFFLDGDVQGITGEEHAEAIARRIVGENTSITVAHIGRI